MLLCRNSTVSKDVSRQKKEWAFKSLHIQMKVFSLQHRPGKFSAYGSFPFMTALCLS